MAVDIRKDSKTFGKWVSAELSEHNNQQLWIPRGFAHGYKTLEDNTVVLYKTDQYYIPEDYRGFIWNDEHLNIDWGGDETDNIILSKQDAGYGVL